MKKFAIAICLLAVQSFGNEGEELGYDAGVSTLFPVGVSLRRALSSTVDIESSIGFTSFRLFQNDTGHAMLRVQSHLQVPKYGWRIGNDTLWIPYFTGGIGAAKSTSTESSAIFATIGAGVRLRVQDYSLDLELLSLMAGPGVRDGWNTMPNVTLSVML